MGHTAVSGYQNLISELTRSGRKSQRRNTVILFANFNGTVVIKTGINRNGVQIFQIC